MMYSSKLWTLTGNHNAKIYASEMRLLRKGNLSTIELYEKKYVIAQNKLT